MMVIILTKIMFQHSIITWFTITISHFITTIAVKTLLHLITPPSLLLKVTYYRLISKKNLFNKFFFVTEIL